MINVPLQEIYDQIEAQARKQGVLPETLINLWLADRLKETGAKTLSK